MNNLFGLIYGFIHLARFILIASFAIVVLMGLCCVIAGPEKLKVHNVERDELGGMTFYSERGYILKYTAGKRAPIDEWDSIHISLNNGIEKKHKRDVGFTPLYDMQTFDFLFFSFYGILCLAFLFGACIDMTKANLVDGILFKGVSGMILALFHSALITIIFFGSMGVIIDMFRWRFLY